MKQDADYQYHLLQDKFSGILLWKTKSGQSENENYSASKKKIRKIKKNLTDSINIFHFFYFFHNFH